MLRSSLCLRKIREARSLTIYLSVCCLLYKRAVYTQLEDYLVEKKLLFDFQSGFRSNFSADSYLTYLIDYIRTQTSKGLYTGMLMLNLQKAFYTVAHDILCKKSKAMGIKSVDWFRFYLSNRNQIVNVNDTESDPSLVTCGVPQGSILGPLLFLCYINDMESVLAQSVNCYYLQMIVQFCTQTKILWLYLKKLGLELEMCSKWIVDNKLSLHMGKTKCIIFGSKRKLGKINIFFQLNVMVIQLRHSIQ